MKTDRIESILSDYVYTDEKDWQQLESLKRLAKIGDALEIFLEEFGYMESAYGVGDECEMVSECFFSVDELLKWSESEYK